MTVPRVLTDPTTQKPLYTGNAWAVSRGCWGAAEFFQAVLRAANIPVHVVPDEPLLGGGGHGTAAFHTADLALADGDDAYNGERMAAKWTYFYLYVILDIFSRYVVGWMIAPHESAALAERLIAETCAKHGIQPGQLTLHADRGTSMKSKPVALLLADLGVTKTHSRPHVSNDNPFSEAQFKTLKYCPQFPERFGSLEDGRAFGQGFFPWYNQEHRHGGLGFLTPAVVHFGQAATVRAQRQHVLARAYAAHPERFVNGRPHPADLPTAVWINPPAKTAAAHDGPGTMILEADDLQVDPILDADDHGAATIIDLTATLITSTLVSQCH